MVSFLILLSGSMIRPVYIVVVWLSETSDVAAEKAFFRDQKKTFF
jgi:hypothetical protein